MWKIVNITAILLLLAETAYFYIANKTNYNKTLTLIDQKKSIEVKLKDLSARNDETLAKVAEYAAKREALTSEYKADIDKLAADKDMLKADIEMLKTDRDKLRADMESANLIFNKKLAQKNSEALLLKKSFKNIDKKLRKLKVAPVEKAVSLEPIVVAWPKNASGEVLEVNKAYEFVVVDLGLDDGIAPGDTLFISRKKALLGKVVVEEAGRKNSAAKILYKALADVVKKGDTVTN